jgi:hypothetical protein
MIQRVGRCIYLCSRELCSNWDSEIVPTGAHVQQKEFFYPRPDSSGKTSNIAYSRGAIRRGLAHLSVHTGPAIDPTTRAERYYVALGYSKVPVLKIFNELLLSAVADKLAKLGCQRILIGDPEPQRPWECHRAT